MYYMFLEQRRSEPTLRHNTVQVTVKMTIMQAMRTMMKKSSREVCVLCYIVLCYIILYYVASCVVCCVLIIYALLLPDELFHAMSFYMMMFFNCDFFYSFACILTFVR